MSTVGASCRCYTYRVWVGNRTVSLLPNDKAREHIIIQNEGQDLFIKLGWDCTLGDYSFRIPPNGVLEVHTWAGPVTGIRSNGSAFAMCTETT